MRKRKQNKQTLPQKVLLCHGDNVDENVNRFINFDPSSDTVSIIHIFSLFSTTIMFELLTIKTQSSVSVV